MSLPPALVLSAVMIVLLGSLAHVVFGRRLLHWPAFLIATGAGFMAGFVAGAALNLDIGRIGSLPLPTALLGAAAGILGMFLLIGIVVSEPSP